LVDYDTGKNDEGGSSPAFIDNNSPGSTGVGTPTPIDRGDGGRSGPALSETPDQLPTSVPDTSDLEINCNCTVLCPVCDGCLATDLPKGCEPCSCPDAPDKIDLCSGGQAGLMSILQWFEHICNLVSIKSDINVRTADLVDINNCLSTGGTAGAYKNGDGYINGVYVMWQVSYAGYPDTDQYLIFNTTDEPGYYRANLKYLGENGQPGITLVFKSDLDRKNIIREIPCFN
jgi:hypothetical protein